MWEKGWEHSALLGVTGLVREAKEGRKEGSSREDNVYKVPIAKEDWWGQEMNGSPQGTQTGRGVGAI